MKKIILSLLTIAILSTSIISCQKDENDKYEYTCIEAQKAADVYKGEVGRYLSALNLGIISQEQATESIQRARDKAMAIIDNAECYVSLN